MVWGLSGFAALTTARRIDVDVDVGLMKRVVAVMATAPSAPAAMVRLRLLWLDEGSSNQKCALQPWSTQMPPPSVPQVLP